MVQEGGILPMGTKTFWGGGGDVHYLDCGDSFAAVYICQILQNCTLYKCGIYCELIIPQLSC